jgi:hypothetical protein
MAKKWIVRDADPTGALSLRRTLTLAELRPHLDAISDEYGHGDIFAALMQRLQGGAPAPSPIANAGRASRRARLKGD